MKYHKSMNERQTFIVLLRVCFYFALFKPYIDPVPLFHGPYGFPWIQHSPDKFSDPQIGAVNYFASEDYGDWERYTLDCNGIRLGQIAALSCRIKESYDSDIQLLK